MRMSRFAADTSLEVEQIQIEIFRKMAPERRLEMACEMSDEARALSAEGVRCRHPHYNEDTVRLAVIRLMLGDDLFQQVYPGVDVVP